MRARTLHFAAAVGTGAVACILHASCGDVSHVFSGRLFVEGRGCLATESSIDVVTGDTPGSCAPVCLVRARDPNADGGRSVYVSTMCGPYPPGFDTSGADPACARAMDALSRNDTCLSDGGSSHPVPDAGGDG